MNNSLEQRCIFFEGRVQGVGFRFTTCRIASRYPVVGYVQNLSDGRVQVIVEGVAPELDEFLNDLCRTMENFIRNVEVSVLPATGEFEEFEIRA